MIKATSLCLILMMVNISWTDDETEAGSNNSRKALQIFQVVRFPNTICGAADGRNGTCYTNSECSARGGTSSGSCASSFGVCCVFTLACGGTSTANNTYATISSYNLNTDADPCTYTFCKTNSDVCRMKIEYNTMVLAPPGVVTRANALNTDGTFTGDCQTDTLTVSSPCGRTVPTICGFNSGQHMWVPASDQCHQININVDTANTGTTRNWDIKVTQYECDECFNTQDCLQWHTAPNGRVASFNWDTSSATVTDSQTHLSHQYYDICIRRASGMCSICYDIVIPGAAQTDEGSFGVSAGSVAAIQTGALGAPECTGTTTNAAAVADTAGLGDYLEIPNLQVPGTAQTAVNNMAYQKICGNFWNAADAAVVHSTVCSYTRPFRIGVHFDGDENIRIPGDVAANQNKAENGGIGATASGQGYNGFWLNYWQLPC